MNQSKVEHTETLLMSLLFKLPLFSKKDGINGGLEQIARELNFNHDVEITQEDLAESLTEFIVRVCNSHDALVEALENLLSNFKKNNVIFGSDIELVAQAESALKLAKGE